MALIRDRMPAPFVFMLCLAMVSCSDSGDDKSTASHPQTEVAPDAEKRLEALVRGNPDLYNRPS